MPTISLAHLPPHPPPDNCNWNHDWPQQKPRNSYCDPTCNLRASNHTDGNINDFVRYFAHQEIVATGLLQFNDKPHNYRAWKRSFENTVRGLDLIASEEMDLLLKWFGKESAEYVEQIRTIHVRCWVKNGLGQTWPMLWLSWGNRGCSVEKNWQFSKDNKIMWSWENSVTYSWSSRAPKRKGTSLASLS